MAGLAEINELESRISQDLAALLRSFRSAGRDLDEDGQPVFTIDEIYQLNKQAQALKSSAKYLRFLLLSDPTAAKKKEGDAATEEEELRVHEQQLVDFERSINGLCEQFEGAIKDVEEEEEREKREQEREEAERQVREAPDAREGQQAQAEEVTPSAPGLRNRFTSNAGRGSSSNSAISASTSSLHRTRGLLTSEIERMSSLGELLQADAASISQTQAEHEAYEAEVDEAKARIKKIKQRNAQDHRVILLAFAILCCVAAYAISGRLLWVFGLKLP